MATTKYFRGRAKQVATKLVAMAVLVLGLCISPVLARGGHHGGEHYYSGGHHGYRYGHHRRYGYRGGYYGGHYGYSYSPAYIYPHSTARVIYGYPYDANTYDTGRSESVNQQTNPRGTRVVHYEASTADRGWSLLAAARPSEALFIFNQQAQSDPQKGIPKVGYALASTQLGDLARGIWAMRRAIRIDPESLHYVLIDDRLRPEIQKLIPRYEQVLSSSPKSMDAAFMLASIHYLLGDLKAAQAAIHDGDHSASAVNLRMLIEDPTKSPTHVADSDSPVKSVPIQN